MDANTPDRTARRRPSLTTQIFLGIGLGILVGVFFGELAEPLSLLGTAFVRLLQMTVLPYVFVSLVLGLGRQEPDQARAIAKSGGIWLLVLWGLALFMMVLVPLAFPQWQSASFFSDSLIAPPEAFDFLGLYIPANPFRAMADNLVPAVVVFSISLGVAMIGLRGGQAFLDTLGGANDALTRIANGVVSLTPIGVFGIAASAAGTIGLGELAQLQVFIVAYVVAVLFMVLWVIPGLLGAVTPIRYRAFLGVSKDALIAAFAIGSVFVVLPILAERARTLMQDSGGLDERSEGAIDVVLPASFSFPSAGTLLSLSFVLFAGWFTGASVAASEYPQFVVTALFSGFGGAYVAIPFLLDQFRISADTFDLYVVVSQVVNVRFQALLAGVHILGLTLLSASAIVGRLEIRWARVLRYLGFTVVGAIALMLGVRAALNLLVAHEYEEYDVLVNMQINGPTVPVRDLDAAAPAPGEFARLAGSALDRASARGVLRVGYLADRLPYAYRNAQNQLVGLDAELMHLLASELGLELEFVKVAPGDQVGQLEAGHIDLLASGMVVTTERLLAMSFSEPYGRATLGFLVKDHARAEFGSVEALRARSALRLGVPRLPYLMRFIEQQYPHAELVPLEQLRPALRGEIDDLDAVVYSAEAGSVWTLVYPAYSVAVPHPDPTSIPVAYALARGDERTASFLSQWIELKRQDGTLRRLEEYWFEGRQARSSEPRWSVIRNVLGWVD